MCFKNFKTNPTKTMLNSQNSISQNARIINNSNPSQMEDIEHTSNSDLNVHSSPSSQLTGIPIMSQTNVRTPRAANMDYFKNLSSSSLRKKTCKPIHCFFVSVTIVEEMILRNI